MLKVDSQDNEKLIAPLFRTGIGFWVLLVILAAIVAWGIYHYIQQLTIGLGLTGNCWM